MSHKTTRSPAMRVAAIMLILSLLMTCAVCCIYGYVRKGTSSIIGTSSASVAKWQLEVNGVDFTTDTGRDMNFNLFDSIGEADTFTTEDGVAKYLFAPGTGGSFDLEIVNKSEVDATYTLVLSETNVSGVYIQYSIDKSAWYDDFTAINAALTDKPLAMEEGSETVTVYWRWCFEGTQDSAHAGQYDEGDTALGIVAQTSAPSVTISANLTAKQQ